MKIVKTDKKNKSERHCFLEECFFFFCGEKSECDLSTVDSFSAGPAFKGEFSAQSRHGGCFQVLRQRGGGSTKVSPRKILPNLLGVSDSHISSGNKLLLAHTCFAISIFRGPGLNEVTIQKGLSGFAGL